MRFLIVTQVFYPDTVSVSQHISDLAFKLVEEGHAVTVFSSRHPYDERSQKYNSRDFIRGVDIHRVFQSSFGKVNVLSRIIDFFTFYCAMTIKLLFHRYKYDVILGSTSPPLLSFIVLIFSKWKSLKFVYWVMDLQPELSIASGLIRKDSLTARLFTFLGHYTIRHSFKVISLDRFMTKYLLSRGASSIATIPVWPVIDRVSHESRMSNPFRIENNFGDKIVIMYSGNHAYVHPLFTLLEAAQRLRDNKVFLFVFVGGGVRKRDVTEFKEKFQLDNVIQLPFQPRGNIHNSLGSADIHVVILGDGQVGYTHPNKVYGALYIAKPILYIGPKESHVGDIIDGLSGNIFVEHGEVERLVAELNHFESLEMDVLERIGSANQKYAELNFHPDVLKEKMMEAVVFAPVLVKLS